MKTTLGVVEKSYSVSRSSLIETTPELNLFDERLLAPSACKATKGASLTVFALINAERCGISLYLNQLDTFLSYGLVFKSKPA